MPRRSRGLGSGSQGPLRGITDLIRNLPPAQQDRLSSAFVDAENLLSFHSSNRPEVQQRRRISGLVATLQLSATSSVLGGFVSWSRLDDPRIAFYEIQTADDNVFSTFETFQSLDTFFSVEGISTTKFIRARGVRLDGETGLWSATKTITPSVVAPTAYSVEFYPIYTLPDSDPNLQRTIEFSGGLDPYHKQEFYTLLSHSFYVNRTDGGLSLWGALTNRLRKFSDPGITPWDRVRFTVNGIHRLDNYFSHWTNNFEIDNANKTDFVNFYLGELISFYAKGGYTAAFGPFGVPTPTSLGGVGPNDANRVVAQDSPAGTFYWEDPFNAQYPSRFDQAQLTAFNDTGPAHESASLFIAPGKKTHWLIFDNFEFDLPTDAQVLGIKADIKRRQANFFNDEISPNFGILRPDKTLGHDLVLEHGKINSNNPVTSGNILEDANFGRYLDLSVGHGNAGFPDGILMGDLSGNGTDGSVVTTDVGSHTYLFTGDKYSVSAWIIAPTNASSVQNFVFSFRDNLAPDISTFTISVTTNSVQSKITNYQALLNVGGVTANNNIVTTTIPEIATLNEFHHIVYTWDGTVKTPTRTGLNKLYIDGVLRSTGTGFSNIRKFTGTVKQLALGGQATNPVTQGRSILGQAHTAIWNKVLEFDEILDLYNGKGVRDYRLNFGDYKSAKQLNHYFLVFPKQADIRDSQIRLVDETGVRTDLENKAITTESWPQLGQFFYTDVRECTLPLAASDGIPHDNHLAIGYQSYGNEFDLWGANSWTPSQINNFYFGLAIEAENVSAEEFSNNAFVDHARLTIFTLPEADREINVSISAAPANKFYLERECFGALFNAIEVGSKLAEIVS